MTDSSAVTDGQRSIASSQPRRLTHLVLLALAIIFVLGGFVLLASEVQLITLGRIRLWSIFEAVLFVAAGLVAWRGWRGRMSRPLSLSFGLILGQGALWSLSPTGDAMDVIFRVGAAVGAVVLLSLSAMAVPKGWLLGRDA